LAALASDARSAHAAATMRAQLEASVTIADMHALNADQIAYWNGAGGRKWTDRQERQDVILAPVSELLFARAKVEPGERVIDIGCGCGSTTIELARRVGPKGSVVGVDVSVPMLARARERVLPGAPIEFVEADATVYRFPPARTDLLCSRFGVMFFAEPKLSFANMRTALRSGGRLVFACWRAPEENPWLALPLKEVYKHVPPLPESGPEDPGPFSFTNTDRVHRILNQAGFSAIAFEPVDLFIDLATGRGLDAAVATALEVGPASRALDGQSPESRDNAAESIRAALAPFQQGQAVPLAAAIWIVTANNR
jgi:SAM-dependent methyltransferase